MAVDPPHPTKPAKQSTTLYIQNSLGYPPAEVQPRLRKQCVNFLLNVFFPDLVHRPTAPPVAAKNRR